MRKTTLRVLLASILLLALPLSFSYSGETASHSCCLCLCGVQDYHKDCHDLCKLPEKKNGELRILKAYEQKMCIELCALKIEGRVHLNHPKRPE